MDEGKRKTKLDNLPEEPGVYVFFDKVGNIVYIGKAKNLRRRVRSYFTGGSDGRFFYDSIVSETVDFQVVVTDNEKEAFLLENTYIRKHKPRYNVVFRDDKRYVSLKITLQDRFPAMTQVRRRSEDGSRYVGPFDSAAALRETLTLVEQVFPVRTCSASRFANRRRPCLKFQVGRCCAPCTGEVTEEEYRKIVDDAVLFLTGKTDRLTERLEGRMEAAAERHDFERAAVLRDQIKAVRRTVVSQKVVGADFANRDVFGFSRLGDLAAVQLLHMRQGALVDAGAEIYRTSMPDVDLLSSLVGQFYDREDVNVPEEILLPFEPADLDTLKELLRDRRGKALQLRVPCRGEKKALTAMACKNAWYALARSEERTDRSRKAVNDLETVLALGRTPRRIECYDISNFRGTDAVGSRVCFIDGQPAKNEYRRYKLTDPALRDDTAMMAEVLRRRFGCDDERPDLVVLDGGRGQLSAAARVLREGGVEEFDLVALAKERSDGAERAQVDRVYFPDRSEPVYIDEHSAALHLLQRVRDEAHRFAVAYHRKLRRARMLKSGLEEVPLIGKTRRKKLLSHFGTLTKIREATEEELAVAPGMNRSAAAALYRFFHEETSDE